MHGARRASDRARERAERELRRLVEALRTRVPLRRVLAFGSFARGDMHELSDLDLVVVGDFEGPRQLRGLAVRDVAWDLGLDVPIEVVPHRRRSSSVRGTDGSSSTSCPRRSISRSIRADAPIPHPTLCSAAHFGRGRCDRACGRRGRPHPLPGPMSAVPRWGLIGGVNFGPSSELRSSYRAPGGYLFFPCSIVRRVHRWY